MRKFCRKPFFALRGFEAKQNIERWMGGTFNSDLSYLLCLRSFLTYGALLYEVLLLVKPRASSFNSPRSPPCSSHPRSYFRSCTCTVCSVLQCCSVVFKYLVALLFREIIPPHFEIFVDENNSSSVRQWSREGICMPTAVMWCAYDGFCLFMLTKNSLRGYAI